MSTKWREFFKAQLSAFIGGLSDLCIYAFCYKILLISAPFSNAISGSLGAVVNFTINRYWSFGNTEEPVSNQLWKFVVVVMGSVTLKSVGIHFFADIWGFHFIVSKLIVELLVSLGFNFTLQKFWVFKSR